MSNPKLNNVEATVLTIDIRNFTYHSSPEADPRFSPGTEFDGKFAQVAQAVEQFHNQVTDTLRKTTAPDDAVVLSTGDGLIVCFPTEGHGRRAVQLAIALPPILDPFLRSVNEAIKERRRSTALNFGIGLHTGEITMRQYTDFSDPNRTIPLILGEALNVSTRIEALTKEHPECRILLSEATLKAAQPMPEDIDLVHFQVHTIRGFGPVRIYGIRLHTDS